MKKIAKYFFVAAASLAAMSCVEELNVVEKPVELTGKAYVFTADFDAETKTVLDEETMTPMWYGDAQGNEYITVMEPGSVNTYVAEGLTEPVAEATFVMAENGGTGLTGTAAFAVSPAGAWTCFNNSTDGVGVTVNYLTTQTAYADTYDPAAPVAVAYNEDIEANPNFSFKNASALLKFQITADSEPVKSVKFYSLGGETLAGEITLMNDADGKPAIVPGKGASSWVEIVAAEGKTLEPETNYYISVAPAVLAQGIGFQFNDMEGIETFTIPTEIKIERNKIYDLGIFRYEASKDDKWYLVGNGTTDFTTVMFQADGDNLVAKNVPFSGEQSFKVLNPAKGVAYYVNAEEVKTDTWNLISEEKSSVCPAKGTYDVYVDYAEETITGVALTTPGTYAPEYLVPAGQYTWVDDSAVEYGGNEYHWAISLDDSELVLAESYDQNMIGEDPEFLDPTMVGKWEIRGTYINVEYLPIHATSGEIRCQTIEKSSAGGPMPLSDDDEVTVTYYLVKYSNLTDKNMDLFSTYSMTDEDGNDIPVLDESGEPIQVWNPYWEEYSPVYYNGIGGLSVWVSGKGSLPITTSYSDVYLEFGSPVLTTGRYAWQVIESEYYEDEETGYWEEIVSVDYFKLFDLGVTEPGVIRIASNYDQMSADPMTGEVYEWADPRLAGTWVTEMRFDKYEIVPTNLSSGEIRIYNEVEYENGTTETEYYLIYYSDYVYNSQIRLHSPYDMVDADGKPIPVEGTDAYWKGLGLEEVNDYYGSMPIGAMNPDFRGMTVDVVDMPTTPDGAQWKFNWSFFAELYELEEMPAVIDLGIVSEGFIFAIDQSVLYGEEEPDYFEYMSSPKYEIIPNPENPEIGTLRLITYNQFDEEETLDIAYEYYGGTMCHFVCETLMLDAYAEIVKDPVSITLNQIAY